MILCSFFDIEHQLVVVTVVVLESGVIEEDIKPNVEFPTSPDEG